MQFQWNFAHTFFTYARIYYTHKRRRYSAVLARRFSKSNIQNCCPAGLLSMLCPHIPPAPSAAATQRDNSSTAFAPLVIYYFTLTRQTFLN